MVPSDRISRADPQWQHRFSTALDIKLVGPSQAHLFHISVVNESQRTETLLVVGTPVGPVTRITVACSMR